MEFNTAEYGDWIVVEHRLSEHVADQRDKHPSLLLCGFTAEQVQSRLKVNARTARKGEGKDVKLTAHRLAGHVDCPALHPEAHVFLDAAWYKDLPVDTERAKQLESRRESLKRHPSNG